MISCILRIVSIDLKESVALRTLNQIAFIFIILSYNSLPVYIYIISHALIKCTIFMCAGSIIHQSYSYQDLRVLSSSPRNFTFILLIRSSLILLGACPTILYLSKHILLEYRSRGSLLSQLLNLCLIYTNCYLIRLLLILNIPKAVLVDRSNKNLIVLSVIYLRILYLIIRNFYDLFIPIFRSIRSNRTILLFISLFYAGLNNNNCCTSSYSLSESLIVIVCLGINHLQIIICKIERMIRINTFIFKESTKLGL